jgi:hypothetical protein
MVIAIDPEAATRRFTAARRTREVSVTSKIDGSAALWVRGPAEQTQHMYDEVERDALARRHDGDPRAIAAIMFEQIYETLTGYRPAPGPDPIPRPHDDPPLLRKSIQHVPVTTAPLAQSGRPRSRPGWCARASRPGP